MIHYLDTSVWVASLTNEAKTAAVQDWLGSLDPAEMAISAWVTTEFSSALSLKLRTGQIDASHRAAALAMFRQLTDETMKVLGVQSGVFATAARFADQHELGLRAGDALHLAIAQAERASLVTLDIRLAGAGARLGIETILL